MRIVLIRGKNLASLRGEFEVALDQPPLAQAGLFAITGQTGAGKSTLLDAMCLALFDKIPRLLNSVHVKVGRSDESEKHRIASNDVASIISRGTAHAYAEVEFIGLDKSLYKARWEVKRARNKVSGRLQKQSITFTDLGRDERIGQNKSDTLACISDKIGLTFEQFRRSVLLAQGDFAAFLKAKSDERSSLLERITGTEIYSQLSIASYRMFQNEDQLLLRLKDKINAEIPLPDNEHNDLEIKKMELDEQLLQCHYVADNCQKVLQWHEQNTLLEEKYHEANALLLELSSKKEQQNSLRQELKTVQMVQYLRPYVQQIESLSVLNEKLEKQVKTLDYDYKKRTKEETQLKNSHTHIQLQLSLSKKNYDALKPFMAQLRVLDKEIIWRAENTQQQAEKYHDIASRLREQKKQCISLADYHSKQKKITLSLQETKEKLQQLDADLSGLSLTDLNQKKDGYVEQASRLKHINDTYLTYNRVVKTLAQIDQENKEITLRLITHKQYTKDHQQDYQQALAVRDEAKDALMIMQESLSQGASSLRNLLQEEQECPVCGSLEHPWFEQETRLNDNYQKQKERLRIREKNSQEKRDLLAESEAMVAKIILEQTAQEKQYKQLVIELTSIEAQWQVFLEHCLFLKPLNEDENALVIEHQIKQNTQQLEQCKHDLAQAISLQQEVKKQQKIKDDYLKQEKDIVSIINEQAILASTIKTIEKQRDAQKKELDASVKILKNVELERQRVFDDNMKEQLKEINYPKSSDNRVLDIDELEQFFLDTITQLNQQLEQDARQLEQCQKQVINIQQERHYTHKKRVETQDKKSEQQALLDKKLLQHSLNLVVLREILAKDEHWIQHSLDEIQSLDNELLKIQTLLQERQRLRHNHEQSRQVLIKPFSDLSVTELTEQSLLEANTIKRIELEKQTVLAALKVDNDKRQRIKHYQKELLTQQASWNNYAMLNELIGSASGHKFRIFAQSLTLETLLTYANEHLDDFARRYQLQRVPATDLDLQVIDRDMADEVRSVQSLSGGESFLVSLALALGLASLSSSQTQVESLFIDEGFGSLDQETLDIAIASLDTLQALGRQVGVISHVPILVERIGVRVMVEKIGGGRSRVSVAG